ncbi:hypothetical protein DVH24_009698 [Malus domestica]|uniref:RNase H type-1 domain-containing protein n=1 Tax=Malus domestica TaxID=3750 RepID=A0A498JP82_MALDO|nr:hypothetical protein DVH24_009698 [Malus domestica]
MAGLGANTGDEFLQFGICRLIGGCFFPLISSRAYISKLIVFLISFPLQRQLIFPKAFQNCRWSWVPRSANMTADALTSRDSTELCDVVWVDRPPSSLVFVLNNDGLPCPH